MFSRLSRCAAWLPVALTLILGLFFQVTPVYPAEHTGLVYDLDFVSAGWTQVLLNASGAPTMMTRDQRASSLLGAAYEARAKATIKSLPPAPSTPSEIETVTISPNTPSSTPRTNEAPWIVLWATFDITTQLFKAEFSDRNGQNKMTGWDATGHAQQIVESAIVASDYVYYLAIDAGTSRITRVKVNH